MNITANLVHSILSFYDSDDIDLCFDDDATQEWFSVDDTFLDLTIQEVGTRSTLRKLHRSINVIVTNLWWILVVFMVCSVNLVQLIYDDIVELNDIVKRISS